MFYALAAALCCAVLFIVLGAASLASAGILWAARRMLGGLRPRTGANLMFALRALPLFLAGLITLGFALPAFLRFEPRSSGEIMGLRLLILAACGGLTVCAISIRCGRVILATRRARKEWRSHSMLVQPEGVPVPVYCSRGPYPLLAVTGVFRPQIFVASTVTQSLSAKELSAAIAHEMTHVSSRDNLKRMVLKLTQLPRWLNLFHHSDAAWVNASEIAADEGAIAGGASALDLSSALVKVGRLGTPAPISSAIAGSHLLPETAESCIAMRVMHLEKLLDDRQRPSRPHNDQGRTYWPVFSLALFIVGYAICLNAVLPWMHEALELLVR
ncbi:MAG TPA: M56 family metallopeptidase [Candidatus Angelobacter sp.]